jgi:hypothetical protein
VNQNEFRAAALDAARRRWHVFPLYANSKVSAIKRWQECATIVEELINKWWPYNSRRGIGVACGPAGLLVIDLDNVRGALSAPWAEFGVRHGREVLALLAQ